MVLGRLANTNLPLPNIASQTVERVTTYKLLGVHIDSTLSWSTHIEHIIKKATTKLYFLKQLKRPGLPNSHLLHFYITVIRLVLEYCAPVWHYTLTKAQSGSLEADQKCAIHITHNQWCIAKNGGGYTQRGVAKGLKVPCLFMITEVSIRCQKNPGGWYTPYRPTRVYPPIHHCTQPNLQNAVFIHVASCKSGFVGCT